MLKHFKMYTAITDIVGEKRIDLDYPIWGKEVTVVSLFSDNVQYLVKKTLKLRLPNGEKILLEGGFTAGELSMFVGRNLLINPMDASENIIKMNKLAGITEMLVSLNELYSSDNLEDGKPSNVLLEFMNFELVIPKCNKLTSISLRIMDQKKSIMTDGLVAIVLNI